MADADAVGRQFVKVSLERGGREEVRLEAIASTRTFGDSGEHLAENAGIHVAGASRLGLQGDQVGDEQLVIGWAVGIHPHLRRRSFLGRVSGCYCTREFDSSSIIEGVGMVSSSRYLVVRTIRSIYRRLTRISM